MWVTGHAIGHANSRRRARGGDGHEKVDPPVLAAFLATALLLTSLAGCGDPGPSGKATTDDPSITIDDFLGTWMVQGQSATQYHLTFYADNTYKGVYGSTPIEGSCRVSGSSVTLLPGGMSLRLVKGPEMEQDKLVGKETWFRV